MQCSYIVLGTFFSNLMAGILPFGAVFIELFFILSVSKHDFHKDLHNHKSRKYLILLLIKHKSVTQWADVFIVHIFESY